MAASIGTAWRPRQACTVEDQHQSTFDHEHLKGSAAPALCPHLWAGGVVLRLHHIRGIVLWLQLIRGVVLWLQLVRGMLQRLECMAYLRVLICTA